MFIAVGLGYKVAMLSSGVLFQSVAILFIFQNLLSVFFFFFFTFLDPGISHVFAHRLCHRVANGESQFPFPIRKLDRL